MMFKYAWKSTVNFWINKSRNVRTVSERRSGQSLYVIISKTITLKVKVCQIQNVFLFLQNM